MGLKMTQEEAYCVGLKTWHRRDEGTCIAWCPGIDVLSQAETQQGAMEALREAVELWFESCIERGVLAQALREVGIDGQSRSETTPRNAGLISTHKAAPLNCDAASLSVTLGDGRDSDCIEARIPMHLLATQELPVGP